MRAVSLLAMIICVSIALAGCEAMSKPYISQTPRVDQKMDVGNRGYLKGTPPPASDRSGLKRKWVTVDVDILEPKNGKLNLDTGKSIIEPRRQGELAVEEAPAPAHAASPARQETVATIRSEVTVAEEEVK
jgi:hypothetical protein